MKLGTKWYVLTFLEFKDLEHRGPLIFSFNLFLKFPSSLEESVTMEVTLKTVSNNIIINFFSYFRTNVVNQQNTAEVSFLHKLLITKKWLIRNRGFRKDF